MSLLVTCNRVLPVAWGCRVAPTSTIKPDLLCIIITFSLFVDVCSSSEDGFSKSESLG